ncbi:MAG: alanine racemase [Deltaproteobacteria bacterium]|nr:alanine racemase [Deltaproteobacteria bacterium]
MNAPLVWAEVDLRAIAHNVRELRRITKPEARLMAAVKANAYGHGMVEVAKAVLQNGADELGVARIEEAAQLREAGIDAPVLIFGHTPSSMNMSLIEFDLRPTVFAFEAAEALSKIAVSNEKKIKIHLKIDTGMGRLGILPAELSSTKNKETLSDIIHIQKLPGIEIEGIYTHFATADFMDKTYARKQFDIFVDFLNQLQKSGIDAPVKHAANSAAVIDMPETHLNMVRTGISVYGLYPSDDVDKSRVSLQPAMELKARIVHLKRVPAGFKVSYGSTYETKAVTTIATVPVGYGDGYSRLLSSQGHMLVRGQRAPVAGRVCMDLTMIDLGHIPDAALGDEVVLFGRQGDASLSIDEIASTLNTINYEVVTTVASRVPRIFIR